MEHLNAVIVTVTGALVLAGLVVAWVKKGRGAWRGLRADFRKGRDTLVGRDPILDTITGRELAPALPGMGDRLDTLEAAVVQIADQGKRIADLEVGFADHDQAINELRAQALERVVARAESTQAYRTIEAAIQADPPADLPPAP